MNNENEKGKKSKLSEKFTFFIIILMTLLIVFGLVYAKTITKKKNKFTEADWQYMHEYIDEQYGKGEHFHIISEKSDIIRGEKITRKRIKGVRFDEYETLGISANIIGYFDSQEQIYSIRFVKYLNDNKQLKYIKAGQVTCTAVVTNDSKDEYLKGGINNND